MISELVPVYPNEYLLHMISVCPRARCYFDTRRCVLKKNVVCLEQLNHIFDPLCRVLLC